MSEEKLPLYEAADDIDVGEHGPELVTPTEYQKHLRAAAEERVEFARAIRSLERIAELLRPRPLTKRRHVVKLPGTQVWVDPSEVTAMQIFEQYYENEDKDTSTARLGHSLNLELVGGSSLYISEKEFQPVIEFMEAYWQKPPVM